ncbi:MAG: hypothetical protein GY758_08695 [Fuerstiella sp.]|nr:hypothetical protein [Fuerstiella sp.]
MTIRLISSAIVLTLFVSAPLSAEEIDFSRDILPLLSDRCFKCHGPDEANRKGGLRLDQHKSTLETLDSGSVAVIAGKSAQSAVFQRISSADADQKMPPVDFGKMAHRTEPDRVLRLPRLSRKSPLTLVPGQITIVRIPTVDTTSRRMMLLGISGNAEFTAVSSLS